MLIYAQIDEAAKLAKRRAPSEAHAAEDGDAWTNEELAGAEAVWPSPSPTEVGALRHCPVALKLDTRPRKTLGFQAPAATLAQTVAATG